MLAGFELEKGDCEQRAAGAEVRASNAETYAKSIQANETKTKIEYGLIGGAIGIAVGVAVAVAATR